MSPCRDTPYDCGVSVYMPHDVVLLPGATATVEFGLSFFLPPGLIGKLYTQAGYTDTVHVTCHQLLDSSECCELTAKVTNLSQSTITG